MALLRVQEDVCHGAEEREVVPGHVLAVVPARFQDVVHVVADPHLVSAAAAA